MQIQIAERRFGLLMQLVQDRDVAPQRLLVAVELDADAVDLRGDVAELLGEPPQPRSIGGEQAGEKAAILERGRIAPARLGKNVRQQFAGGPELPVLGLGQDPVGELDHRTLRAIAEGHDARPVGDVDLGLDSRDRGGVHHDRRDIDGFAHRASSPKGFIPAGNMVPRCNCKIAQLSNIDDGLRRVAGRKRSTSRAAISTREIITQSQQHSFMADPVCAIRGPVANPSTAHSGRGLIFHAAARMLAVIKPVASAATGIDSANAAVAAQPIEENASANVASRDDVWRRRN
jgi:hypothetical protein